MLVTIEFYQPYRFENQEEADKWLAEHPDTPSKKALVSLMNIIGVEDHSHPTDPFVPPIEWTQKHGPEKKIFKIHEEFEVDTSQKIFDSTRKPKVVSRKMVECAVSTIYYGANQSAKVCGTTEDVALAVQTVVQAVQQMQKQAAIAGAARGMPPGIFG